MGWQDVLHSFDFIFYLIIYFIHLLCATPADVDTTGVPLVLHLRVCAEGSLEEHWW
jgi:hypothetical protein